MTTGNNVCPRCGIGRLRGWKELSLEEQMVAHRLPYSENFAHDQRVALHRWCTKCWYEETAHDAHLA